MSFLLLFENLDTEFYSLTKSLPDDMIETDIYRFMGSHPAEYAALIKMREDRLATAGYTTKGWHGSTTDFTVFDINRAGKNGLEAGPGFYFTDSHQKARAYGTKLKSVFLRIKNPLIVRGAFQSVKISNALGGSMDRKMEYPALAKSKGYDAIVRYDISDKKVLHEIVVHNPSQIKSAKPLSPGPKIPPSQWGNSNNDDIRY